MVSISVLINYRDRPTELALLLQSLWTQKYHDAQLKIYILDDCSGTTLFSYHFLVCLFNKLSESGIPIVYNRNEFNLGVSKSRQKIVDWALKDGFGDLFLRVDDDVILDKCYIYRLLEVIARGYDLASGVTPFIGQPSFKRESKFIEPVGNKVILDDKGNFIHNGDDCGMLYHDKAVLPLHHFRSCALYKKEIHEKVNYDSRLTKHGFREEEILSFKMIVNGYKLGLHTQAIAWHLQTPSGGERFADSNDLIRINEKVLHDFTRELYTQYGDFIADYNKKLQVEVPTPTKE